MSKRPTKFETRKAPAGNCPISAACRLTHTREDLVIPGSFAYHRPASLKEAVGLLAELGEEARPLAGGHSLVPMMKLRLATPAHLVDLRNIDGLKGIRRDGDRMVIGA